MTPETGHQLQVRDNRLAAVARIFIAVAVVAVVALMAIVVVSLKNRGDGWQDVAVEQTRQNAVLRAQVEASNEELACARQASFDVGKATDEANASAYALQAVYGHLIAAIVDQGKAVADGDTAAVAAARAESDRWSAQFDPASSALDIAQAAVAAARTAQERALTECAVPTPKETP